MDPTLTRSEAHKVFGELYRKPRSPELQSEVDRIVSTTSDIFARIRRIEELDERENLKERAARSKNGGGAGRSGAPARQPTGRSAPSGEDREEAPKPVRGVTLLTALFGGKLATWGAETGTLQSSFFGLNLRLSSRAIRTFSLLREEQIIESIKAFRLAVGGGWRRWNPSAYNSVLAVYQFFVEYTKMAGLLRKTDNPQNFLMETFKFQSMYASMLQYPNYLKTLNEEFIELINAEQPEYLASVKGTVKLIGDLSARTPSLKNIIIAFYVLTNRKLIDWNDVTSNIKIMPPILDRFRAPESVLSQIAQRVKKLSEELKIKKNESQEIDEIQNKYFKFDEKNRIITDFLDQICMDVIRRTYNEKYQNENFVKSQKRQPHRLLNIILKDFDLVYLSMLDGASINVRADGGSQSVVVFKQGLFRAIVDELNGIHRDVEIFNKKNTDVTYTFKDFQSNARGNLGDETLSMFFQIIRRANKVFRDFSFNLKTVLDNQRMAIDAAGTKGGDKLERTKSVPIESLDIGMRFIPYWDHEILSSDRLNGKRVEEAISELLMNLYNYLYIYRDENLVKTLSSGAAIRSEIETIETELKRLGSNAPTK
jgi:hypothetical protein